jgi:tetratricopeptide (TPR) repeat protein
MTPEPAPDVENYMGFLCVKRRQFDQAIEFLDKGMRLEPTKPKFKLEKARALVHSGRREETFALVNELGPHVISSDLAFAQRGRGFVLIELGQLDEAENAFKASLELEPQSEAAWGELQYIAHLREGGAIAPAGMVSTTARDASKCVVCGNRFNKGMVASVDGMPTAVCKRCHGHNDKEVVAVLEMT